MNFRTLRADEIDLRVGVVKKDFYTLLLYKDARCDMNILDETVGKDNWMRDHKEVKGNLYCGVAIWDKDKSQWIWKWDCGTESFSEKEKGEASDSFKRACFNWGIGRELYTSPYIAIYSQDAEKESKTRKFRVKSIAYNDKKEITSLVIVDSKGVQVYPKPIVEQKPKLVSVGMPKVVEKSSFSENLEDMSFRCEDCDKVITGKVYEYSKTKYNKPLCVNCQKKAGK